MLDIDKIKTILNPRAFERSAPPGFDGIFDWSFLDGCFSGKIRPADIDAIIEKNGQFLIFETKAPGVSVPIGQGITLHALWELEVVSVVLLWGKLAPEYWEFWVSKRFGGNRFKGKTTGHLVRAVKRWFERALLEKRK